MTIDIFGDEKFKDVRKYFLKREDEILVEFEEMGVSKERWKGVGFSC
jgi:hypothetical protein